MRRLFAGLLIGAAMAGAAMAAPPAGPPGGRAPPRQVFLSPSGEPFRLGPNDPDPLKAWFDQADTGHLGYLDRAEFRADAGRFFKVLDENGDGIVDGFEVADYEAKVVPELAELASGSYPGQFGQGGQQGGGQGGGQGQEHGHRRGGGQTPAARPSSGQPAAAVHGPNRNRPILQLINEPEPVSGADFNLDSHITLDEWMRATDQRFDILDANKDGRLTLDALRAALNKPPGGRRG
jgi:hypothetical protein